MLAFEAVHERVVVVGFIRPRGELQERFHVLALAGNQPAAGGAGAVQGLGLLTVRAHETILADAVDVGRLGEIVGNVGFQILVFEGYAAVPVRGGAHSAGRDVLTECGGIPGEALLVEDAVLEPLMHGLKEVLVAGRSVEGHDLALLIDPVAAAGGHEAAKEGHFKVGDGGGAHRDGAAVSKEIGVLHGVHVGFQLIDGGGHVHAQLREPVLTDEHRVRGGRGRARNAPDVALVVLHALKAAVPVGPDFLELLVIFVIGVIVQLPDYAVRGVVHPAADPAVQLIAAGEQHGELFALGTRRGLNDVHNHAGLFENIVLHVGVHALIGAGGNGECAVVHIDDDVGRVGLGGGADDTNRHYHREREQQGHELLHGSDLLFLNYYSAPWGAAIIESITHPPRRASTGACRWADRARCGIPRASFRPAF